MGEYADEAVDCSLNGQWSYEGDDDEGGYVRFRKYRGPQPKTCRKCGTKGLFWEMTDDGWRLHKVSDDFHLTFELELHICKNKEFS